MELTGGLKFEGGFWEKRYLVQSIPVRRRRFQLLIRMAIFFNFLFLLRNLVVPMDFANSLIRVILISLYFVILYKIQSKKRISLYLLTNLGYLFVIISTPLIFYVAFLNSSTHLLMGFITVILAVNFMSGLTQKAITISSFGISILYF